MIPVSPPPEPAGFDSECRSPGTQWLRENPNRDPHQRPLWRRFTPDLRKGFKNRCGFLAMRIPTGTIDHWVSIKTDRTLAYQWDNYRFVDRAINCAKKPSWEGKLLDPFEIQPEWFEVLLPSLQLIISEKIDPSVKDRAAFTLEKLGLGDGEDVIRLRQEWLDAYETGMLSFEGLLEFAPLIAHAVAKRDGLALPSPP